MSVQPEPAPATSADLESTAELPVLDVAGSEAAAEDRVASTDTWSVPGVGREVHPDGALEAQLRALAHELREVEERLSHKDARLIELEREIEQLAEERRAAGERLRQGETAVRTLAERDVRIAALEIEVAQLAAAAQRAQDASPGQSRIEGLQRDLQRARAEAARHLETLQSIESRRGIWDSLLRALDHELGARDSHLAERDAELARRATLLADQEAELERRSRRIASLEGELNALAAALAARSEELLLARSSAAQQLTAERAELARQAERLQTDAAGKSEAAAVLQTELNAAVARAQELEADVRAAEDTIHRLEAELRSKSSRLDELVRASDEWRSNAEHARRSLEEREARITRLEADVATSAELVGTIKQSLERLEPLAAAAEPPPEGAMRLMVRTSGDSEVVHVLGRRTTVGRTPDNDLQIDARFISRHHAVILAGPVQTVIEDLNSTNGVRVNGRRTSRQALKDGDIVIIGKTRFRFVVRPARENAKPA